MPKGDHEPGSNARGLGGADAARSLVHEINNRLFVVRMGAATVTELLGDGAPESVREKLDAVIEAAEQATSMIAELGSMAIGESAPDSGP